MLTTKTKVGRRAVGKSRTAFSINSGIGLHLLSYNDAGLDVRYAIERLAIPCSSLAKNLGIPYDQYDSRYFINRKEKGAAKLLELLGLEVGELDLLDATSNARTPTEHRSQNLYDCFGLARILRPRVVVAFTPEEVVKGRNPDTGSPQELEKTLNFLRFNPSSDHTQRHYFVISSTIDTADYGSGVSKKMGLVVGVREDLARSNGVSSESQSRLLLPSPTSPKSFRECTSEISVGVTERRGLSNSLAKRDIRLIKLLRDLEKDPKSPKVFQTTEKGWADYGYGRNNRPRVIRSSLGHPISLAKEVLTIHAEENRELSTKELRACLGVPDDWVFEGRDADIRQQLQDTIPSEVAGYLCSSLLLPLLDSCAELPVDDLSFRQVAIERLEGERDGKVRQFFCDIDVGEDSAKSFIGKTPSSDDYEYLFDANDINEDFVVYGAYNEIEGRRDVVGAIRRSVFAGDERDTCINTIKKVKGKTDKRVNECPLEVTDEMIARWERQGQQYKISEDRRRFKRKTKTGKWDTVWRSVAIPTSTIGWTRDKITGLPQKSSLLDDADVDRGFRLLNSKSTGAYRFLAFDDFVKQARFVRKRISKENTISAVFTTMAVNRYGNEMPAMNYHIDSGDDDSGLTTISVFDEGYYEGGLFVLPRYKCAFRIGDGDVFVANSRQVHGVSKLTGEGRRLSVVSYTKTNLAAKENLKRAYPAKSPRPKFRVSDYQIAIPSYKRDKTLRDKTLRVLERYGVDPRKVTIFVANQEELEIYKDTLGDSPYANLVVAIKGIMEVRNFMWNYFPEGTPVLFMDDDLTAVKRLQKERGGKLSLIDVNDLYAEVVVPGFTSAREYNAYLWGIFAASNAMFMSANSEDDVDDEVASPDEVIIGNQYIIGSFFGAVIRHKENLLVGCADKEDHERSVVHFIEDGRTLKLKYITVESNYYGEQGGLQEFRTLETVSEGAKYMKQKYPQYVRVEKHTKEIKSGNNKGKKGVYWEVKHT